MHEGLSLRWPPFNFLLCPWHAVFDNNYMTEYSGVLSYGEPYFRAILLPWALPWLDQGNHRVWPQ